MENSWKLVDIALDLNGGFAIFKQSGFERIWWGAPLGKILPANSLLATGLLGKIALGIDSDEAPRRG